ncbi:MAG: DUF2059 domain-containing protein, partial [Pseudomonadota bacterium]
CYTASRPVPNLGFDPVIQKVIFGMACLALAHVAAADAKSHEAAARELLEVMETSDLIDQMNPQLDALFKEMMPEHNLPPEESELMDAFEQELKVAIYETVSWARMEKDFLKLYMNVFSESEIRELTAFYRTPLGQKTIEKMPQLTQESMQLTMRYIGEMDARIDAVATKYAELIEAN